MHDEIRSLTIEETDDVSGGFVKELLNHAVKVVVGVLVTELIRPIDFSKLPRE